MRKAWIGLWLIVVFLSPCGDLFAEQALSLGYGFAAYNLDRHMGKIEGGDYYDFFRLAYLYEKPVHKNRLAFVAEPFASYVNRPTDGAEWGLSLNLRYYPFRDDKDGFYMTAGPGMAYTTIGFHEQGTHLLFIVQGGVGYRYKNFFIEDTCRHYSNGGTAHPNWSVNTNIVSIGFYF